MYIKGTNIYKTETIYNRIKECMEKGKAFGICRLGNAEVTTLSQESISPLRSVTQGIPIEEGEEVLNMLRHSANYCDYVASIGGWLTEEYFPKNIKPDSVYRRWEQVYENFGITNKEYCHLDIGYLIFLEGKYNLWNLIRNKRICCVTSKEKALELLVDNDIDVGMIEVTPQTTRQDYKSSGKPNKPLCDRWHWHEYEDIKLIIKESIRDYDIFLIGAGYLGKGYSAYIKNLGGISFDVGKVMDTWSGEGMGRMKDYVSISSSDPLSFELTEAGKPYEGRF